MKHDDYVMIVLESNIPDELLASRQGYWWRQFDCENLCVPNRTKKEYYQDKRETILEYNRKYQEDNREKISIRKQEKLTCDCGCIVSRGSMPSHIKSHKHKRLSSVPPNSHHS